MAFFLVGIVGVNYDAHYCGGKRIAESFSFVPQDLSCGMTMGKHLNHNEQPSFTRICCENEHIGFQIDDDYNHFELQGFTPQIVAVAPPTVVKAVIDNIDEVRYECIGYSPPPLEIDLNILYQTFLI